VFAFGRKLIEAYAAGTDIDYPALTDGAVTYPKWSIPKGQVKKVVDALTIQLVPVVNPDGRDFVIGPPQKASWRGNRNRADCGTAVDLNRNFDIGWAIDKYYSATDEAKIVKEGGTTPVCTPGRDTFRGKNAGTEKETLNIQQVIDDGNVRYYVDVHSQGRRVLTPWGLADNQAATPGQNFLNATHDRKPNGTGGREALNGTYKEFLPDDKPHRLASLHDQVSKAMVQAILDQAGKNATAIKRSTYLVKQIPYLYKEARSLPHIMPVPGGSSDYALARQFKPGEPKPAYAFALEIGWEPSGRDPTEDKEDEGGFWPSSATKYEKIERETHAALFALLRGVVNRKGGP
jgi:hypothetical protein